MKQLLYSSLVYVVGAPLIAVGQTTAAAGRGVIVMGEKIEAAGVRIEAEGHVQGTKCQQIADEAGAEKETLRLTSKLRKTRQIAAAEAMIIGRQLEKLRHNESAAVDAQIA